MKFILIMLAVLSAKITENRLQGMINKSNRLSLHLLKNAHEAKTPHKQSSKVRK